MKTKVKLQKNKTIRHRGKYASLSLSLQLSLSLFVFCDCEFVYDMFVSFLNLFSDLSARLEIILFSALEEVIILKK